jgi:hypothetical protein
VIQRELEVNSIRDVLVLNLGWDTDYSIESVRGFPQFPSINPSFEHDCFLPSHSLLVIHQSSYPRRQWQLPSNNPQNITTYNAATVKCAEASNSDPNNDYCAIPEGICRPKRPRYKSKPSFPVYQCIQFFSNVPNQRDVAGNTEKISSWCLLAEDIWNDLFLFFFL